MTRAFTVIATGMLILIGGAATYAAISPLGGESSEPDATPLAITPERAPAPIRAAKSSEQQERVPSGNPLWAIPLRQLSATRDRPIFSPSRRPPAPAVIAPVAARPVARTAPPKPVELEKPQLTLVGTIVGEVEKIAVFTDLASKKAVRLKLGEDHQGWVFRGLRGREVTLVKGGTTAVVSLPAPGKREPGKLEIMAAPAPAAPQGAAQPPAGNPPANKPTGPGASEGTPMPPSAAQPNPFVKEMARRNATQSTTESLKEVAAPGLAPAPPNPFLQELARRNNAQATAPAGQGKPFSEQATPVATNPFLQGMSQQR